MTDNDDLRERAKVEQIDRDAAAAAWVRWHDMDTLADAFARHRLAAIEALQQRVERLEGALEKVAAFYDSLSRPHDEGEAEILDGIDAMLAARKARHD